MRDGISELEKFLQSIKEKLESDKMNDKLEIPTNAQDVLKPCFNIAIGICEKFRNIQRYDYNLR